MRETKRVAIVGTAPSWNLTSWNDPGLEIWSLNDAYLLPKFGHATAWFDLHPLDKFVHPVDGKPVFAHTVPPGHYVRPATHHAWLGQQAQTMPVYLHPDYLAQHPEAKAWPRARAFPKADVEAMMGQTYFTSSPSWMVGLALMLGFTEVQVTGIHLSTEHEYVEQRPNFEFLLGRVLGGGTVTTTVAGGLRRYTSKHGVVVMPEASPVLASSFQYAFQPRTRAGVEGLKWDLHRYQVKRERAVQQLRQATWFTPTGQTKRDIAEFDALIQDTHEQMQRVQVAHEG